MRSAPAQTCQASGPHGCAVPPCPRTWQAKPYVQLLWSATALSESTLYTPKVALGLAPSISSSAHGSSGWVGNAANARKYSLRWMDPSVLGASATSLDASRSASAPITSNGAQSTGSPGPGGRGSKIVRSQPAQRYSKAPIVAASRLSVDRSGPEPPSLQKTPCSARQKRKCGSTARVWPQALRRIARMSSSVTPSRDTPSA
jgi:hypothetical protein